MINANQHENDQSPANDAAKAPAPQPQEADIGKAVANAMLLEGEKEGAMMMLQKHPEWRDQIVAYLHRTKGNLFVASILNRGQGRFMGVNSEFSEEQTSKAAPPAPAPEDERKSAIAASKMDMLGDTFASKGGAVAAANASAESSKDPAAPAPEAAKPQMDTAAQAAPPAPAPVESKKEPAAEQAPPPKQEVGSASQTPVAPPPAPAQQETRKEPAAQAPVPDAAPPGKQEVASAGQAPEAAPKPDEKAAIEKGQEEKPQDKADGEVKITASALRVRAAPNMGGKIIGKIPRGGKATVKGQHGVWLEIVWPGGSGFIHSKYTTSVKGNESGEEEEEHQGEESSHEQKQERPKAPPMVNDDQQKAVV